MRTTNPRISIIIPAYNVEKYIEAALESVFVQDTPAYEVIVIDDGSTDSTPEKIARYSHRSEFLIITTENRGQGRARNVGLRAATGDYIYFFDSDDLLESGFLTTITSQLRDDKNPDLILFSGQSFRDQMEGFVSATNYLRPFQASCLDSNEAVARLVESGTPSPSPCLYVSKRSLWQNKQISFKSIIHEDDEIFLRLILSANSITVISDVLFYRRIRERSTMSSGLTPRNAHGLFVVALTLVKLYKVSGDRPKSARRAIRKRAIRTAQRYMRTCRKVCVKPDVRQMLRCAYITHSIELAIRAFIYATIFRVYCPKRSRINK